MMIYEADVAIPIMVEPMVPILPSVIRIDVMSGVKTNKRIKRTFAVTIEIVFT